MRRTRSPRRSTGGCGAPASALYTGRLGRAAIEYTRTGQAEFKEAGLSKGSPETEILAAMAKTPILMERPVVVRGERAVIGRPPEDVLALL